MGTTAVRLVALVIVGTAACGGAEASDEAAAPVLAFAGGNGGPGGEGQRSVVALGKKLFFDQRLSVNGNQACAACHGPQVGWTGPDAEINVHGAVYEGSVAGRFGNRKPPSSGYATLSPVFNYDPVGAEFAGGNFWDGRATGWKLGNPAADQAQGPFLNPVERPPRNSRRPTPTTATSRAWLDWCTSTTRGTSCAGVRATSPSSRRWRATAGRHPSSLRT